MALLDQDGELGKVCTKCKTWRPVARFPKRAALRDGYDSNCRECHNLESKEWRKNNPDRVSELNEEYYQLHHEERKAYHRAYRQKHLEHMRAIGRKYRSENGEYFNWYAREWGYRNPDSIKARDHARIARKRGNGGKFTAEEWQELKKKYNYTCLRCRRKEPDISLSIDHVIPISKGGHNSIENIQPLCLPCNVSKHIKSTDYRLDWNDEETP